VIVFCAFYPSTPTQEEAPKGKGKRKHGDDDDVGGSGNRFKPTEESDDGF